MGVLQPLTGALRWLRDNLGEFLSGGDPVPLHDRITDQNVAIQTIDDELAALQADVDDPVYGLAALQAEHDVTQAAIQVVDNELAVVDQNVDDIKAAVNNPTYGLAALQVEHDVTQAALQVVDDELAVVDTNVDSILSTVNNVTYGNAALKTEIDANEAKIDALQLSIDNLQQQTGTFHLQIDDSIELPETGTKWVPITLVHRDADGNVNPSGGAPVLTLSYSDGTDASALIYSGQTTPGSRTQTTTMTGISAGYYRSFLLLSTSTAIDDYHGTASATHNSNPLLATMNFSISQVIEDNFTTADRVTIDDTNTKVTEIQTNIDSIDSELDTIRETADGGFDRETDSLEAIRDAIDTLAAASGSQMVRVTGTTAAPLAQGGAYTWSLNVGATKFNIKDLVVKRSTGASTKFEVYVYEDAGETIEKLHIDNNRPGSGDMIHRDDTIYINQDTPSITNIVYVKVINNADAGSSDFTVDLRGIRGY